MRKKIKLWIDHHKTNIYLLYTILFFVFCVCAFSPFKVYGKAYLWGSDGISQHYPSLIYTKDWLHHIVTSLKETASLDIPYWNLSLGLGQDVFGNAINFRVFNFLYVFFRNFSTETYLKFRAIGSLYLCGLAFICFAKSKSNNKPAILLGTLIYLFSGFALYFTVRHPFFLEMMFYFPLMLKGIDIIFEKKKSYLFIAMVFFSSISYFYFLYMITLPAVIYALFRYFEIRSKDERSQKDFWLIVLRFVWQYAVGLLLSAFSLLPSLFRTFNSSRTSVETGISYLHWNLPYYKNFLKGIIDMQQIGIYGFVALSGIAFLAVMYMIFDKNPRKKLYLGQFVIYTLTFLVPFLTLAFSGFAGRTQRWCYVYIFWIAMIVVEMLPKMLEQNTKVFVKSCICTLGYLLIYLVIAYNSDKGISSGILWLFVYVILLIVVNFTDAAKEKGRWFYILLIGILCIEVTMKSYDLYSPKGANYIAEFADSGRLDDAAWDNASTALEMVDDDSLYRTDVVSYPMSKKYNQMNYGLRNYVNGISSYYSFSDNRICQYSLDLGNSQQNIKFLILDWDQRTVLNELSGVKYLATTHSSNGKIPYGYILRGLREKEFSDGHSEMEYLYENQYALPLMYTYNSYIPEDTYARLQTNEKEQAMLQGVVLEEGVDYPKTNLEFNYNVLLDKDNIIEQMKAYFADNDSVEVYDDHFIVKNDNTSVMLNVEPGIIGELYWVVEGNRYHSENMISSQLSEMKTYLNRYDLRGMEKISKDWSANDVSTLNVQMGDDSDTCTILNNTYQYYFGTRDSLLNLGYMETSDTITLNFGKAGEYSFDDLKLISQPMDDYEQKIGNLKSTEVRNVTTENNSISGNVYSDDKKMVCISVPYSEGWKAYINGEETKVYPANGMNMAVMVDAGSSEIYLQYETPGLYLGCIISLTALGSVLVYFVVIGIYKKVKRRKES